MRICFKSLVDCCEYSFNLLDLFECSNLSLSLFRIAISSPPKSHCIRNIPNKLKGMFELKLRTLETLVPTVVVHRDTWKELADFERLPFLEQLVNEKLQQR